MKVPFQQFSNFSQQLTCSMYNLITPRSATIFMCQRRDNVTCTFYLIPGSVLPCFFFVHEITWMLLQFLESYVVIGKDLLTWFQVNRVFDTIKHCMNVNCINFPHKKVRNPSESIVLINIVMKVHGVSSTLGQSVRL